MVLPDDPFPELETPRPEIRRRKLDRDQKTRSGGSREARSGGSRRCQARGAGASQDAAQKPKTRRCETAGSASRSHHLPLHRQFRRGGRHDHLQGRGETQWGRGIGDQGSERSYDGPNYSQKHQGRSEKRRRHHQTGPIAMPWSTHSVKINLSSEESLLPLLLPNGPTKERRMMKDHSKVRLKSIWKLCDDLRLPLESALSLRRQHIMVGNPYRKDLGLGSQSNIRASACLFEEAVGAYLNRCGIKFLSEEQQKQRHYREHSGTPMPPTPDFMLTHGDVRYRPHREATEITIHWIEAKMFYGASSIPADGRSAVGRLEATAEKYVSNHGTGAMVFMQGCGQELRERLHQKGVMVLDAEPTLDLTRVKAHQRTWCANYKGTILP